MTNKIDDRGRQVGGDGAEVEEEYEIEPLEVPAAISVHDLAELMMTTPVEVIKEFMRNGHMFAINDVVEHDIVTKIAPAFGFEVLSLEDETGPGSIVLSMEKEDPSQLETRPPVVTILGHVDHGKTTLLDTIRKSNVVSSEAGGITQHIGAYQVETNGNVITFLDTPGHAAFTAMRARGAQVTDIAVIVVAADDGIMPQTEEAINHVKAAGVPIVVAINKIDRPDADPERVKRQLAEHDLLIEEWGGDVIAAPVSALTGDGVPELLENLIIVAEIGEFKANPNALARGVVVEARRDKSRGTETTVLVQNGTLRIGDNLVVGALRGRIRAMFTDRGEPIDSAGPSQPVEVLGVNGLPEAGDIFEVTADEKEARQIVEMRQRQADIQRSSGPTLDDVHTRIESGEVKALNLIVKTDVQGSVEAIKSALNTLNTDRARVNLVHAASGSITESDILLAVASKAIVIGFNSVPEQAAQAFANQEGVEIRNYSIIYNLLDDVELALSGILEPVYRDVIEGQATVRAVFRTGRRQEVAGFYVNEGRIARDSTVHVMRGGEELHVGAIASLKHFKDDVREVGTGLEGGLMLDGFNSFEEGDVIEAHRTERVS
ncbi:MAG: translation initiation factor IF-2 [Chloroflexi bacterium]|nr:translation initiation factor IF-2 [Chloroflexota bacterium]MCI0868613.1 translation initiation factor IF-2 [Chloroflexota bacterium]MCI0886631.1 translation initiation factor IF-2 [Chloroflexota bacterium]